MDARGGPFGDLWGRHRVRFDGGTVVADRHIEQSKVPR